MLSDLVSNIHNGTRLNRVATEPAHVTQDSSKNLWLSLQQTTIKPHVPENQIIKKYSTRDSASCHDEMGLSLEYTPTWPFHSYNYLGKL